MTTDADLRILGNLAYRTWQEIRRLGRRLVVRCRGSGYISCGKNCAPSLTPHRP